MNREAMEMEPIEKAPPNGAEPELDYERPKHHWIVWLVVLLVAAGITFLVVRAIKSNDTVGNPRNNFNSGPVPVVVATARVGAMPIYLWELGTVTPYQTVTVHTRVDGQLTKVAYQEGQIVHEGDLLAEIDSRPYQALLEQAQGQLARDQALLDNAQVDLKRYEGAPNAVTDQQLATQKALVAQYQGTVKTDQGQVDNAQVQLDYCRITSPLTGLVGLRQVDQGNIVHASDANGIAVIAQLQPITVVFSVIQQEIPQIMGNSQSAPPLQADAFDNSLQNRLAGGTVSAIDSQVDTTTMSVKLKANFENKDSMLFPNQFVNIRLRVKTLRNVVIVPSQAVQRGPDNGTFVYVVKSDDTVEVRNVMINSLADDGEESVVDTGLLAGEKIVTVGVDKLIPGAKVDVRSSTTQPSTTRPGGRRGGGRRQSGGTPNSDNQTTRQ